jgi:exopolysaccharide biosynthesis polyprenyl glycosylphosphotransferase
VANNRALHLAAAAKRQAAAVVPYAIPRTGSVPRLRTRLQQRRPKAVRRHAVRWLLRTAATLSADVAAVLSLQMVVRGLAAASPAAFGGTFDALGGALASDARFGAALLLSLVVTGNYGLRGGPPFSASLLRGCARASALTLWRVLLEQGAGATLLPFLVVTLLAWLVVGVARGAVHYLYTHVWPGARGAAPAVFVGSAGDYTLMTHGPVARAAGTHRLLGYVASVGATGSGVETDHSLGSIDELPELIDQHAVETIIVDGHLTDDDLAMVFDVSITAGCELLCSARSIKIAGGRPKLVWRGEQPYFELGAPVLTAHALFVKRVVDVLGAAAALVVFAPVLVAVSVAIKLDSAGPVLFTQHRAGLGGRRFRMLKFRTMRIGADAEKETLAHLNHTGDRRLFKIPCDPRVTRLGGWLRRWSVDELPQLWNVLRGDMSLVGPRPFFESDLDDYEDHHFRRLGAKPGITGLWQVSGRSSVVDFEEVVRLDREYIEEWSPLLDLRILARTVPAVLGRRGAH